ncbi:hypothetical protein [Gemmiger qucibialis]|uniref:hypothetical protein n=1 Tax=Gemmiger qucibialis TaxID=2997294 RepID=UPI0022DF0F6A|nr:hypothetical protein [Gemmiger qucibialis]
MKQKSSQMRFAPWPVVQAALALALSGLLLARPQAAAQGFAAGLKLLARPQAAAQGFAAGLKLCGGSYCPRCSHCLWCAACWGRWLRRWGGRCGL